MADRKNPVFLRVFIVVVALLLGFSLNMFQFRNPFRSVGTDPASGPELSDKNRFPSRQETALPVSPVAKPPQPEVSANGDKAAQPQEAAKGEPKSAPADAPAPANAPAPAPAPTPQSVAEAEPDKTEKQGSPVSIAVEHETPSLGLPKVTSDAAKAKAAKIGRQVATGVVDGKKATEAPAPAETGTPSVQAAKAPGDASADKAGSKASQTPKPAAPAPAETGTPPVQAAKAPGDAAKAPQESKPAKDAAVDQTAAVQTPQASQPAPDMKAGPGKNPTAQAQQAAKPAQTPPPANGQNEQSPDRTPQALDVATTAPSVSGPAAAQQKAPTESEKPGTGKGSKILDVKAQDKPGEFVLTIVTDGPVEKVSTFHAKGPARLAIDLQGSWQSVLAASIPMEGELFERVRVGAHPDKLRLVIDYRDKEFSAFSELIVERQPKGVVIRIPKAMPKS